MTRVSFTHAVALFRKRVFLFSGPFHPKHRIHQNRYFLVIDETTHLLLTQNKSTKQIQIIFFLLCLGIKNVSFVILFFSFFKQIKNKCKLLSATKIMDFWWDIHKNPKYSKKFMKNSVVHCKHYFEHFVSVIRLFLITRGK